LLDVSPIFLVNPKKSHSVRPEVLPHLLEFAQDQHGSRFLQGKLDEASAEESDLSDLATGITRTSVKTSQYVS